MFEKEEQSGVLLSISELIQRQEKEDKSGFRDTFKAYLKKSELKNIRFHDLRHTHATLLLKQGVHPKIVSERLDHKDAFITLNRYSHFSPSLQKDAVKTFSERLFGW
ncbi:tyrosine-type recombinase/integrase [Bacillus mycoides]|nr:tyrosine-type recombinase/integrase [Bacillus mycoides]HDR7647770.1 tyrosine-type recombinase/integrase [Bacillus mycoides]